MKKGMRKRHDDRIISHGATEEMIKCDFALGPFDTLSREMDIKWGVSRLPELVSVETAQKFGAAMAYMNTAINEQNPDKAAAAASNCIKGLRAMDAEAERLGRKPAPAECWQYEHNGRRFALIREAADWTTLGLPADVEVVTLNQVAIAMEIYGRSVARVAEVQKAFPGAEVVDVRSKKEKFEPDQDVPF